MLARTFFRGTRTPGLAQLPRAFSTAQVLDLDNSVIVTKACANVSVTLARE